MPNAINTMLALILLSTSLVALPSFDSSGTLTSPNDTTLQFWENPTISCSLKARETPVKRYPSENRTKSRKRDDPADFIDFCTRMEECFEISYATLQEADTVYRAILNGNIIKDESYGMPHPDATPRPALTLEDIKKRVKIKRISEGKYEIFYSYSGCGTNYRYDLIEIKGVHLHKTKRIEAWKGSYPC